MSQVKFAPAAIRDLQRLQNFLRPKSPDAARRASNAIRQGINVLFAHPHLGRIVDDLPEEFREWLIEFGGSGYVARYRIDEDGIVVLAIRHFREVGFNYKISV